MSAFDTLNAAVLAGVKAGVKTYEPDLVNEYDRDSKSSTGRKIPAKRMTIQAQEEGKGAFKHGQTVGRVTINKAQYKVQVRIVVTLVPDEETEVVTTTGRQLF